MLRNCHIKVLSPNSAGLKMQTDMNGNKDLIVFIHDSKFLPTQSKVLHTKPSDISRCPPTTDSHCSPVFQFNVSILVQPNIRFNVIMATDCWHFCLFV